MAAGALKNVVEILNEYIAQKPSETSDELKFASDSLSLYLISAENEGILGFSEELFRRTIEELLEEDLTKEEQENEVIPQQETCAYMEEYTKLSYRKRRGSVSATSNPFAPLVEYPKSQEVFDLLYEILLNTRLIVRTMDQKQMKSLVSTMYLETVQKGEQLITQGAYGNTMYLVESGEFQVVQDGNFRAILRSKSLFGEISLLYSFPRTASVLCVQDARVWVANSDSYTAILMADQRKNRELICQVLEKNNKYSQFTVEEKDKILRTTHLIHFSENEKIDITESGVFLTLDASSHIIIEEAECLIEQGSIIRKGGICKAYLALLFIPDSVCSSLGLE